MLARAPRSGYDDSCSAADIMLTAVECLLNNTCNIFIILARARRARHKPTVLCEVLFEVKGRLDRTCHNFVTVFRCGRVARGICPLTLDFLVFPWSNRDFSKGCSESK